MESSNHTRERSHHLLALSANHEENLREQAEKYARFLENSSEFCQDLFYSLNISQVHSHHRLALGSATKDDAAKALQSYATGQKTDAIKSGVIETGYKPKVAFLFTGQGAQYAGMAKQLYNSHEQFRKIVDTCQEILRPLLPKPLLSVLFAEGEDATLINETGYTQPCLFVLEYAIAQMWRSFGVEPDVLIGHSVGEVVAACVAGVFSLEDGLKLIAARGRLMQSLPAGGEMVATFGTADQIREVIEPFSKEISLAGLNGPKQVVISGAGPAMAKVMEILKEKKIRGQKLTVSHAFHSPLMDPILDDFFNVASDINFTFPKIGLISNLSGKLAERRHIEDRRNKGGYGAMPISSERRNPDSDRRQLVIETQDITSPDYWVTHIRNPVNFTGGMETIGQMGVDLFLEVGPNPILFGMAKNCLPDHKGLFTTSLKKGRDDWAQLTEAAAELFVRGVFIDFERFETGYPRKRVAIPR